MSEPIDASESDTQKRCVRRPRPRRGPQHSPPPLGPAQRSPTQLIELRRDALRRNERNSAQRAPARLTEPSRGALSRVAPPAAPALLPPLYYYPYQTGAAPTTRPASSRRVTSFRRGARARGGAGRARSRVTILTVSRHMLVERRERTSWGMRERARVNCLSVCLSPYRRYLEIQYTFPFSAMPLPLP